MKANSLLFGLVLGLFSFTVTDSHAQGDQILDGIGETGLIARYTFEGDAKDWSRNNFGATIHGTGYRFLRDELFNNVLSLTEEGNAYLSLPGESIANQESISITGWFSMSSLEPGQVLFDVGKDSNSHIMAALAKAEEGVIFQAQIETVTENYAVGTAAPVENRWNHFAVVMDVSSKTLSVYLNGALTGELEEAEVELSDIFNAESANNKLFFGRSIASENGYLISRLHDFRLYRIPLSGSQVSTIFENAMRQGQAAIRKRREAEQDLPKFSESTPQLYNAYLSSVEDIQVETIVGNIPRLPRYVAGVYKNNIQGPEVRVIWPAPEDNSQVSTPGTYTISGTVPGTNFQPKAVVKVMEIGELDAPQRKLEVFKLDKVTLDQDIQNNTTKFIQNRDKFINVLATTNPDNFLYMFRNAFGQEQPEGADALRGWDSQETKLRGHATGHYMTAIAQAYASTSYDASLQANFAKKMEYMVEVLFELSQLSGQAQTTGGEHVADPRAVPIGAGRSDYDSDLSEENIRTDYWNWGSGFISAYPPDQFIMLEKGATYGRDNTKVWAPYYTLHKILAGLMDIYDITGDERALEIVKGMGNWVHARLSQLSTETLISIWNTYIAGEFGGMNEAMARLYLLTDEPRYLETAQLFDNIRMFYGDVDHSHGLAKNVDMFRSLHANQHIPQIMGALEIYRASDTPDYFHIADNFWYKATNDYMYSIGGVAGARNPNNAECFVAQPGTLYENGLSTGGQNETCATYNMLKLTRNLFLFNPSGELMDYYERGLYNHILASVDENTPANTYHVPLRPGSVKGFGNAEMTGFSCCNGTALESSTKLQNSIYFRSANHDALYVNLFIPSTLNWEEKKITIKQTTSYPREDHTRLTISGKGKFDLKVRVPKWATKGFFVKVNGKDLKVEAVPGEYVTISRKWKNGDNIEVQMPFQFHLEPIMDQQNIASIFYGPVLLAAQEAEPRNDWRQITLNAKDINSSISGDTKKLEFMIDGVLFKPFYDTYDRHSVYLDVRLKE